MTALMSKKPVLLFKNSCRSCYLALSPPHYGNFFNIKPFCFDFGVLPPGRATIFRPTRKWKMLFEK